MWVRVLAFNVLIVFVPVAGVLSLGTYERQLLRSLERSLVQQGRVLAASLEDSGPRLRDNSLQFLKHMRQRHDARLRVVDSRGVLLADSARIAPVDAASGAPVPVRRTPLQRTPVSAPPTCRRRARPRKRSSTAWLRFRSDSGENTCAHPSLRPSQTSTTAERRCSTARRSRMRWPASMAR